MRATISLDELRAMLLTTRPDVAERLAKRRSGRRDLEDKTQEAMTRGLEGLPHYDPSKGAFFGWMCGIAKNVARGAFREAKRERELFLPDLGDAERTPSPDASPEEACHWQGTAQRILSAAQDMPEPILTVFVLHDCDGHTHVEVGQELGIPIDTSKSRLRIARLHIRKRMGRFEDEAWAALPPGLAAALREEQDFSPAALETASTPPLSFGAKVYEFARIGANACTAVILAVLLLPSGMPSARCGLDRGIAKSVELWILRNGTYETRVLRVEELPAPTPKRTLAATVEPRTFRLSKEAGASVEVLVKKGPTLYRDTLPDRSPDR